MPISIPIFWDVNISMLLSSAFSWDARLYHEHPKQKRCATHLPQAAHSNRIYSGQPIDDYDRIIIYFISNGLSGAITESVRVLFPVVTLVTL
jgi:fatty acid-binding protein DegV